MSTILSIANVSKVYGSRTILAGINFSLAQRESLAITGPSGCGKSTLLNIIGLLESPTSGELSIGGISYPAINSGKAALIRRTMISYLFQSYALIQSQTAIDNVLLGMKYAEGNRREKTRRAEQLLARLGLAHVMRDQVFTLSGGEQQRVALARCILKPGQLILADEPTGALDPQLANSVLHEILQLQHEYGKSLIVVTHDRHVAQACDYQLQLPDRRHKQDD
ncbi:MAG: ABC transporter ATP-binding protein [Actinomycetaceae bacterium]|nr:ABC transporter ATP-binding protein [Actinomycetaceae bacterium]MDY5853911.1 ABC transporter ATP-binding protein [Arcanobacterium sp.]